MEEGYDFDYAMHTEHDAWQEVCQEFNTLGMDVNNPVMNVLVKSICVWGERLHALRALQQPVRVQDVLVNRLKQLAEARAKREGAGS